MTKPILVIAILVIVLLAAGLRFHAVTLDARFHPDEALFSTFARTAAVHGDWMFSGPLDKSPLSLYAAALAMHFFAASVTELGVIDVPIRQGEVAARLPAAFAGIIAVALIYRLGTRLYSPAAGGWAALLLAVSPMSIAYSASAFTDPLMLTFGLAAAACAAARPAPQRLLGAGVLLALSVWSKQQGVFFLPLVALLVWWGTPESAGKSFRQAAAALPYIAMMLLAFACGIGLLLVWDAARGETSLFALAAANNNPGRVLTSPHEWLPRLRIWLAASAPLLSLGGLTALLAAGGVLVALRQRQRADFVLLLYGAGYFGLHWIGALNTYERYLLPLAPVLALLAGRAIAALPTARPSAILWGTAVLTGVLILAAAHAANHVHHADEPDPEGILSLAAYLNARPLGAIVYDHWLGWQMGYYLGAWTDKRRVYYPEPGIQAADALRNPDLAPRYLIAPAHADLSLWLEALERAGFAPRRDYAAGGFVAYRLLPP